MLPVVELLCWKVGQTTVVTTQLNCCIISMFWLDMKTLLDLADSRFCWYVSSHKCFMLYIVQVFHLQANTLCCFIIHCCIGLPTPLGWKMPNVLYFTAKRGQKCLNFNCALYDEMSSCSACWTLYIPAIVHYFLFVRVVHSLSNIWFKRNCKL